MPTQRLSEYWRQAGELLGFAVEAPYEVILADGRRLTFAARLPQFGASLGMLLSDNYESFEREANALLTAGYGFSVLTAPDQTPSPEEVLDVLQDWGWSAPAPAPSWLGEA